MGLFGTFAETVSPEARALMEEAAQNSQRAKTGLVEQLARTPTELPPSGEAASSAGVFNAQPPSALESAHNMADTGLLDPNEVKAASKYRDSLSDEAKAQIDADVPKAQAGDVESKARLQEHHDNVQKLKDEAPSEEATQESQDADSDSSATKGGPELNEEVDPTTDKIMSDSVPSWKNMSKSEKGKLLAKMGMKTAVLGGAALGVGYAIKRGMGGSGGDEASKAQVAAPAPTEKKEPEFVSNEEKSSTSESQPPSGPPHPSVADQKQAEKDDQYGKKVGNESEGVNLMQQLLEAQQHQNNDTSNARMLQGANTISAALTRQKADPEAFEGIIKDSQHYVQQLQQKMQFEQFDPNSDTSRSMRALAESALDKKIPSNVPASTLTKAMPFIQKAFLQDAIQKRQESILDKKSAEQEKLLDKRLGASGDKTFNTDLQKMGKAITAETASSRSAFGRAANTNASAEKLQALVANRNPNDLSKREVYELARQLDSILSNGQATVSGADKLVPHTLIGNAEGMAEYVFNQVRGAQGGSFVTKMMETVAREKALANDQIQKTQGKILSPYKNLYKKDPEAVKFVLKSNGIPEDVYERENSQFASNSQTGPAPQKEAAIQSVMKANPGISRDDAINALEKAKK